MVIFCVKTITFVQILCRTPMHFRRLIHLLCVLSVVSFVAGCTPRARYISISGYAQGGTYTVKISLEGVSIDPESIKASVDSILTLIDTTLSGYNPESMISRFNAGEAVRPNSLFEEIYDYSADIWERTGGCVDVACGPLFDIWGFGFSSDSLPSPQKVEQTLTECGMGRLHHRMGDAVSEDGMLYPSDLLLSDGGALPRLNFNAIAQGYSCDMVAGYLHSIGIHDMLVDIGEIYCEGLNPSGLGWTLGVDRPVDGNMAPGADIDGIWCSDGGSHGVVTSGNYRKFYIRDGRKYAHTIDPRTGYPVEHNLLSATVVAPSAALADALATYCMVVGADASREFISSDPSLEGYLICSDGEDMQEWASEGFSVTSSR